MLTLCGGRGAACHGGDSGVGLQGRTSSVTPGGRPEVARRGSQSGRAMLMGQECLQGCNSEGDGGMSSRLWTAAEEADDGGGD